MIGDEKVETVGRMNLTNDNTMTKTLLACGVIAGPLYTAVGLVQAAIRPGFDITRHSLSLLANGDLGWIQVLNFLVLGVLLVAASIGMKRALKPAAANGRRACSAYMDWAS